MCFFHYISKCCYKFVNMNDKSLLISNHCRTMYFWRFWLIDRRPKIATRRIQVWYSSFKMFALLYIISSGRTHHNKRRLELTEERCRRRAKFSGYDWTLFWYSTRYFSSLDVFEFSLFEKTVPLSHVVWNKRFRVT